MTIRTALTILLSCGTLLGTAPSSETAPQDASPTTTNSTAEVFAVSTLDELAPRTEADRAKARFFDRHGSRVPLSPGEVQISTGGLFAAAVNRPTYRSFLEDALCKDRLIVVGRVEPQRVRLNNAKSYLFTEHLLDISIWVSPRDRMNPNKVELLVPGGEVLVDGRMTSTGEVRLQRQKRYLLVLTNVPGTDALALNGAALPSDDWVQKLGGRNSLLPEELLQKDMTFDKFIQDLLDSASVCSQVAR